VHNVTGVANAVSLRIAFASSMASAGIVDWTSSEFATQMYCTPELVQSRLAPCLLWQVLKDSLLVSNVSRRHEGSLVCSALCPVSWTLSQLMIP